MKQLTLSKELKREVEFGGRLLKGKRKSIRPFAKKKAMHVTFRRSDFYANLSLLRHQRIIVAIITGLAKKHAVRVWDIGVNSNHIHFLLRGLARKAFQNFLRECSIAIVRLMTKAKKGKALKASFWESRPWSRIVEWGRAFSAVKDYIVRNRLEAAGVVPYDRSIKTRAMLEMAQPFLC